MKTDPCHFVRGRIPSLDDGSLLPPETLAIRSHLLECPDCSAHSEQFSTVRQSLQSLPKKRVAPALTTALRVIASKERARRTRLQSVASFIAAKRVDMTLMFNNLMRPLAIPCAGGLMAATLVFSMIVSSYPLRGNSFAEDVPTQMYTEASFKGMVPLNFSEHDVIVDLIIDDQGRVLDYAIAGGARANDPVVRRSLDNMLLFTEFRPATSFGQPVSGKLRLSFQRGQIDVRG